MSTADRGRCSEYWASSNQFENYRIYWIPSIPNFANIDAALLLKDDEGGNVTLWCFQYTIQKDHKFNARAFRTKFLQPVLQNFKLGIDDVTVKMLFIVPDHVKMGFGLPKELDGTGWNWLGKQS